MRWRGGWLTEEPTSFGERLARVPLALLSWAYGAVARAHGAAYRRGLLRPARVSCRVVSVGSPVAGGTAKTPTAAWIASHLHERGHKVVLASRGYGRSGREPVSVVSDGRRVRGRLRESGDEPALLVGLAPGVPVIVGPDRAVVSLRAISAFGADVVVLDDGMQHHRLARDVEIVTLDGHVGLGNGWVLPRGPLREPLAALRRADAVLVVDGPLSARDEAWLQRFAPGARRAVARREPRFLRALDGGAREPVAALRGRRVGMLCGIARPQGLRRTLEALGAEVVAERIHPDHHPYRAVDVRDLGSGPTGDRPDCWITTEKDAVKILPGWVDPTCELRVLGIRLAVENEDAFLDWLHQRVR